MAAPGAASLSAPASARPPGGGTHGARYWLGDHQLRSDRDSMNVLVDVDSLDDA